MEPHTSGFTLFEIPGGTRGILDMWYSITHNTDGNFNVRLPEFILAYPSLAVDKTDNTTLLNYSPLTTDISGPLQMYVATQAATLDVTYTLIGSSNRGTVWWRILEPPPVQTHQPTSSVQQEKSVSERINQMQDGYMNTMARLVERMESLEYKTSVISDKLSRTG